MEDRNYRWLLTDMTSKRFIRYVAEINPGGRVKIIGSSERAITRRVRWALRYGLVVVDMDTVMP